VTEYWLLGLAMMLVIEGIMPFAFPSVWRESFTKLLTMSDGQLRFMGVISMLSGLLVLYLIN